MVWVGSDMFQENRQTRICHTVIGGGGGGGGGLGIVSKDKMLHFKNTYYFKNIIIITGKVCSTVSGSVAGCISICLFTPHNRSFTST